MNLEISAQFGWKSTRSLPGEIVALSDRVHILVRGLNPVTRGLVKDSVPFRAKVGALYAKMPS